MTFIKNIVKKIVKKIKTFNKKQTIDLTWKDYIQDDKTWSSGSIIDKENSLESPLPTSEQEEQFSILNLNFYTRFEDYQEAIRNEEPEIYEELKSWFGYFEAHICSWANIYINRRKYEKNKFDQELNN